MNRKQDWKAFQLNIQDNEKIGKKQKSNISHNLSSIKEQ